MKKRIAVAVAVVSAALALAATPAAATWSIVAVDQETGEVGAALASCVAAEVLGSPERPLVPLILQPGTSVAVTQGQLNLDVPARVGELTAAGAGPERIIAALTSTDFDPVPQLRQHAVVDLTGEGAAFTGAEAGPVALDAQGPGVSVQGNLLTSPAVVADALSGFLAARDDGARLADALVAGLLAGSDAGGDVRCGPQTALFAQLVVAGPGDPADSPGLVLTVTVDEGDGQNPVGLLADARAAGSRGVVDGGRAAPSGRGFRSIVIVAAVVMVIGGGLALWWGLGSVAGRRRS